MAAFATPKLSGRGARLHHPPLDPRAPRARGRRRARRRPGHAARARPRARGRAGRRRAAAVDRAPAGRGRARRASASPCPAGHLPYLGAHLAPRARGRAPARAPPRRRAARPRRRAARRDRALVPPHGARGDRAAPRRGRRRARARVHEAHDPRAAHALGLVLDDGRDELQLAPAARPRGGPRLRRLARGLPPRGHGPLARASGRCSSATARATARRSAGCGPTAPPWSFRPIPAARRTRRATRRGSRRAGACRGPAGCRARACRRARRRGRPSPRRPEPCAGVGAADAVVGDVDGHASVRPRARRPSASVAWAYLATFASASETTKYAAVSTGAGRRCSPSVSTRRPAPARGRRAACSAGSRPRSVSTAGWMPRASSRSSARLGLQLGPARGRAARGLRRVRVHAPARVAEQQRQRPPAAPARRRAGRARGAGARCRRPRRGARARRAAPRRGRAGRRPGARRGCAAARPGRRTAAARWR